MSKETNYDSWNTIPYDSKMSDEDKGAEFDAQWNENGGDRPPVDNNPFSKENFRG